MPRSQNKIWLEVTWYTKDKIPVIRKHFCKLLLRYCKNEFIALECKVKTITVRPTRMTVIFKPNLSIPIAATIQQIKGSSSFYINHQRLLKSEFEWEKAYSITSPHASGIKQKIPASLKAETFSD